MNSKPDIGGLNHIDLSSTLFWTINRCMLASMPVAYEYSSCLR